MNLRLVTEAAIRPSCVLVAIGRRPNIENLGLESLNIRTNPFVPVDEQLRTSSPSIFAIGDVNGLSLLDSAAVIQARTAIDAIHGGKTRFSARWVPRCIHTDPSIASIGWNEDEAGKAGLDLIAHSQTFRLLTDDERSVVDPEPTMLKILIQSESRQIFGVHVYRSSSCRDRQLGVSGDSLSAYAGTIAGNPPGAPQRDRSNSRMRHQVSVAWRWDRPERKRGWPPAVIVLVFGFKVRT